MAVADTPPCNPLACLVLLPGLGGTGDLFAPLIAEIGDRAETQVIAYPPDRILAYDQLIDFVRARLPVDRPFVLLAESFSGPIGLSIAARPPPNLRGLILCCTFGRFPDGLLRRLGSLLPYFPTTRPPLTLLGPLLMGPWRTRALTSALRNALARVDPRVLRARARDALAADLLAAAGAIELPLLYLAATHDRIVSAKALNALRLHNPRIEAARLTGPHFLLQCNPGESWTEIARFLTADHTCSPRKPLPP